MGSTDGVAVGRYDGLDVVGETVVGSGLGGNVYETSKVALSEAHVPSEHASVMSYVLTSALPGTTMVCDPSLSSALPSTVLPSAVLVTVATIDAHDAPSPW